MPMGYRHLCSAIISLPLAATVTLLSLPASIRDANHQEWNGPLLSDRPEAGAGSLAAELAGAGVAAECLAPRPYQDVPHCNAVPMLAGYVAGGPRSEESESPGILAEVCQPPVRRWRSLADSVGAFSGPSARNGKHAGRAPVRRSHPGHGRGSDTYAQPEWLHAAAGASMRPWGARSHWHGEFCESRVP
jgi:hypothetical protein